MYRASAIEAFATITDWRRPAACLIKGLKRVRSGYRDRQRLEWLSDHELRDIGLHRSDVDGISAEPWHRPTE